jgi:Fe-S cluster biosynthesis and repair protein YggX
MDRNKASDMQHHKGHLGMNTPPIVSRQEWEAARQQMLVKEKALMRARDARPGRRASTDAVDGGGEEV